MINLLLRIQELVDFVILTDGLSRSLFDDVNFYFSVINVLMINQILMSKSLC